MEDQNRSNPGPILFDKQSTLLEKNASGVSELSRYGKNAQTKSSNYTKGRDSQGSVLSNDSDKGSHRATPYELRRPFIVFNDDASAANDIQEKRKALEEINDGRESTMYNTNLSAIVHEIAELKKNRRNRRDCYSMILDERNRNPFMQKILKSSDFSPQQGVTHIDRAGDASSPRVSGGEYQHPNKNIISRKEFELRKSLSNLKQFGPDYDRSQVGKSLDVSRMGSKKGYIEEHGSTSVAFSTLSGRPRKLPAIKMMNREVIKDLLMSDEEASIYN